VTATTPAARVAGEEADDDAQEVDDAVNNGHDDVANAVDDGHDGSTNGPQGGLEL
jgi:hypothetical protein